MCDSVQSIAYYIFEIISLLHTYLIFKKPFHPLFFFIHHFYVFSADLKLNLFDKSCQPHTAGTHQNALMNCWTFFPFACTDQFFYIFAPFSVLATWGRLSLQPGQFTSVRYAFSCLILMSHNDRE